MATIAELQAYCDAAAAALASGDYATARRNARAGLAIIGGIPTGARGAASFELANARQALQDLLEQCAQLARESGGGTVQRTAIRWLRRSE
jgi:hypothetical protein